MIIFQGRTNRRDYAVGCLASIVIFSLIGAVLYMALPKDIFNSVWMVILVVFILVLLPITIRRMQDVGQSGFWVILAQIGSFVGYPIWSVLITILLLFWRGRKEATIYGEVPVTVGGFVKPLFKAGSVPIKK